MPRRFLEIPMDVGYIQEGWAAFAYVRKACAYNLVSPGALEWRYVEDNYGHMVAVFEVAPMPHRECGVPGAHDHHDLVWETPTGDVYADECDGRWPDV